ncbi:hypothetical protein D3C87_1436250 [compost metagenome]
MIVLVVIIEGRRIQAQRPVHEGVLGADLESIDVFRRKLRRQGLILNHDRIDIDPRRIGAASLVAPGIGGVDQGVVREGQVRLPVHHQSARQGVPALLHIRESRIAAIDIAAR